MNYIIATSKPWGEPLAKRLELKTSGSFHLITKKSELTRENIKKINPRYIFFPHWSYIVPRDVHDTYECVIFHMTDLPYGRGGSPLQNLIQLGHSQTKISALRCVAELDAGPIYMKRSLELNGSAAEIFHRAAQIIEVMIEDFIHLEPEPYPQVGEPVNFSRRSPDQSDLRQAQITCVQDCYDFVRMLDADGYPKAYIDLHGCRLELSGAEFRGDRLIGKFTIYKKRDIKNG